MPLPEIDITDLPDGGTIDPKDKLAIQRLVLGNWQDFYIEAQTISGPSKVAIFDWDMSGALAETISASTPGNYLIPLRAYITFTPGGSPTASLVQVLLFQGSSPGQYIAGYTDGTVGQGAFVAPASGSLGTPYSDLDQDINVTDAGGGPYSGTSRIVVEYVEIEPI